MIDIYRNSQTHNYDIDISVKEWKEILCLPQIKGKQNILYALEKWYLAPNHTASCKLLGEQHGRTHNFFSRQNQMLGEIAVRHLKRLRLVGNNGKETYWGVAWIELNKKNGIYTMRLRPELIEAIKTLEIFIPNSESSMNEYLQIQDLRQEPRFEYRYEKIAKPSLSQKTSKAYPRNPAAAKNALSRAEFKCEFDPSHNTFSRMIDGLPYMETHHLIPLQHTGRFDISIDVPENIVSLCSICHDRIHYGQTKKEIIKELWDLRKKHLHKIGIDISLSELFSFYST